MGGLFSIYEGILKLNNHEGLKSPWTAIGILVFSVAMEAVSLWGCLKQVDKARGGKSLWRWFRQSRQSELIVVLGEDVAALAGLVLALFFVGLSMATHDPLYDAIGSIAIGILLVLVALLVALQVIGLLIGQSAEPEVREAILEFLENRDEVAKVFNLITLQLGEEIMVAIKARMRETSSAEDLIADINRCERGLKSAFPQIRWTFFEPDRQP
jgi:divalent metal cation (Fe/Co/Zn/Cd) transporter